MTLSILIWLPLAAAVLLTFLPRPLVGWGAVAGSVVTLGIALSFLARFHVGVAHLQFLTNSTWIPSLGIHYKLGLDGLNVLLVVLTCLLFTASLVWSAFRE
ncbi:MAG TPA: NADH-quinone oxidoreductase subunit M, partial [Solirubrobacteraceae bacterium]|nr:NADH-quinone oxidoreductase subunit M [Solirubrobacteraceae bacterium]